MIILVCGLLILAVFAGQQAGGADKVLAWRNRKTCSAFCRRPGQGGAVLHRRGHHHDAGLDPQQDVFQRVMSAMTSARPRSGR
jgi:hypothetical protein